ncbi:MAG: hypothetical protein ACI837_002991 [Crocinitomicaceae bacterium]|jgi:hypothetical protein
MKIFIVASLFSVGAIIGLSSMQWSPESLESNEEVRDIIEPIQDSVYEYEVRDYVEQHLLSRLVGQAGLESSWTYMDKSGHRTMVFPNAGSNFKNADNNYIQLNDKGEVFGDVVRLDGSFQSHVCSFKIVYPDMELYARRSALDQWQNVIDFTGVKELPKTSEGGFEQDEIFLDDDALVYPEPAEIDESTSKKSSKRKRNSRK